MSMVPPVRAPALPRSWDQADCGREREQAHWIAFGRKGSYEEVGRQACGLAGWLVSVQSSTGVRFLPLTAA